MEQILSGEGQTGNSDGWPGGIVTVDRREPAAGDRLVQLKPGKDAPALICFHQGGGQLDIYREFVAALPDDLPVWGIQADPQARFETLGEMAESYLPLLGEIQPEGPYRLFGFSLGGFIALETAALLEGQGDVVAFVGLADAKVSAGASGRNVFLANALIEIEAELKRRFGLPVTDPGETLQAEALQLAEALFELPQEAQFERLFSWVRAKLPETAPVGEDELKNYMTLLAHHVALAGAYEPKPIETSIHTWNSTRRSLGLDETDWSRFTADEHIGRHFDVTHFELMRPPVVGTIADEVAHIVARQFAADSEALAAAMQAVSDHAEAEA